jgi:hypothetical protein
MTHLDLGCTYLDLAQISRIESTVRRNHQNARRVHDTVTRRAPSVYLEEAERKILETKLAVLKMGLELFGTIQQKRVA